MMTVVLLGRRVKRKPWTRFDNGTFPPSWGGVPELRSTCRAWRPDVERGSAKPGRGGRRKRRRRAAGLRAFAAYRRAPFLSSDALLSRACRLLPGDGWSPGDLGRRKRRRRAKLRRRRARRERALVRTLKAVRMWGSNAISRLVTSGADPTVKLYGVTRTPGV